MRLGRLASLAVAMAGCGRHVITTPPPPPPDPWVITCTTPPDGLYLSNGEIGMKVGPAGDGADGRGRPLPVYIAVAYRDKSIQHIASPFALSVSVSGQKLSPGTGYRQSLNMRTGIVTTEWKQECNGVPVSVEVDLLLSRRPVPCGALRFVLHADRTADVSVAYRAPTPILVEHPPHEIGALSATSIGGRLVEGNGPWSARLTPSTPLEIEHVARIGRVAPVAGETYVPQRFDDVERSGTWNADVEIEGNVAAQQMVRSWLFNLDQSLGPGYLPPMGFSSDWYAGRVFWDQETWMLPALMPFEPGEVRRILEWRISNLGKALANAKSKGFQGALYPWESTPDGEEGAPAEFQNEIHVTGDVLFAAHRARDWGIEVKGYERLAAGVARFWASRVKDGHIRRVISPDEGDLVDDDLYTNALAAWCLREGARYEPASASKWRKIADGIVLPKDPKWGIYLTYAGDKGRSYKQAAALLTLYPLEMPMDRATQERMFDFYKDRAIKNGPAMTDSIHAIVAARLGRREEMEKYFARSYEGFEQVGLQFSEKRSGTPRAYFITGAGGCLQAVLYGVAGLEIFAPGVASPPGFSTKDLGGGYRVGVRSILPRGWTKLTLKGIRARGHAFSVVITSAGVRFREGG